MSLLSGFCTLAGCRRPVEAPCQPSFERTSSGDSGSFCSQSDESECDSLDGQIFNHVATDCSQHCVCVYLGSNGQMVVQEM